MYLARYSNQPDLGAYLPRLQVPNSLLHSFKHSNIRTFFFSITSNQTYNYTKKQEQEQQQIMSLVGGLCFCTACNNLLERVSPTHLKIQCEVCGTTNPSKFLLSFLPPSATSTNFPFHNNNKPSSTLIRVFESLPLISHLPRQLALDHRRNFSTPLPPLSAPNQTPRKRAIRL